MTDGYFQGTDRSSVEGMYVNIYQLLMTVPGERVGYPEFGIGIRSYLFAPSTDLVIQEIRNIITLQMKKYLSYLAVDSLYITFSPVGDTEDYNVKMIIVMNVRNTETSTDQQFLFNFSSNNVM
jgi:phage baseplate assembly protein W